MRALPGLGDTWATLSEDGRYRYCLGRSWADGPRLLFVMLNPSTADAELDDPTIRRCRAFAARDGFGSLEVVNLFAYRATDPHDLVGRSLDELVGPENDGAIAAAAERAGVAVAAWGANARRWRDRVDQVVQLLERVPLLALGVTKDGDPRHPLYLRGDAELVEWRARR